MNAIDIALSGAFAATARLSASASNIANMQSDGALPDDGSAATASPAYQAVRVDLSPAAQGGVLAQVSPAQPGYTPAYDPAAPYADAQGQVAAPNVDLAGEMVNQIEAQAQFSAAISTIRTADQMQKALLDIKA